MRQTDSEPDDPPAAVAEDSAVSRAAGDPAPPSGQPAFRAPETWLRVAFTYALAGAGGYAGTRVGLPLPWMLGPFFLCGAVSAFGGRLMFLPMGREAGQIAVGLTIGLRFTPATLAAAAALVPAMILATAYVIAYTMAAAFVLRPLARIDRTSAFFATAAGGVADMAIVAHQRGGDPSAVAIVHALRVANTVALVPLIVVAFGAPGRVPSVVRSAYESLWLVAFALAISYVVARLLKPAPIPNRWLVGPMFVGLGMGATGLLPLVVPSELIVVAQVLIGTWLGCRFRREILVALPRVALAGVVVSLMMIACAGGGALVLSAATALPVTTSFLALAPAAVTEMVITAKVMHLDAEIITAFHMMRIAVVASTVLLAFRLYQRLEKTIHGSGI